MRTQFLKSLPDIQADLPPLVDQPDGDGLIVLGRRPVIEVETETLRYPCLPEQAASLPSGGFYILRKTGDLREFGIG